MYNHVDNMFSVYFYDTLNIHFVDKFGGGMKVRKFLIVIFFIYRIGGESIGLESGFELNITGSDEVSITDIKLNSSVLVSLQLGS